MFWIILLSILVFAGWITYEIHRAPYMEDDVPTTTTEWDDNKNHTEGNFN